MYLKSSVVLVFVAVFIAFTAVILNKDKIFWPRNLWARHNSATYGFSFRYPPNLTVLDQDPKTSSINNSALYLELVDSETHFGSVDIIPVRQQVRFKGFKESVPIKDGQPRHRYPRFVRTDKLRRKYRDASFGFQQRSFWPWAIGVFS